LRWGGGRPDIAMYQLAHEALPHSGAHAISQEPSIYIPNRVGGGGREGKTEGLAIQLKRKTKNLLALQLFVFFFLAFFLQLRFVALDRAMCHVCGEERTHVDTFCWSLFLCVAARIPFPCMFRTGETG